MSFAILGLGTAHPATAVSQHEGKQVAQRLCHCTAEQATWVETIFHHSGVNQRHVVFARDVVDDFVHGTNTTGHAFLPRSDPDDRGPTTAVRLQQYAADAAPLAVRAAQQALKQSGLAPGAISHLVTVSCTGFQAPGVDFALMRALGLRPGTERTHVGYMGCHGALNGLRVARAFTSSQEHARVLMCAVELCSLHYFYQWDPQKIIANALFGDGAGAVVGAPLPVSPRAAWQLAASGSCLFPSSADDMTWTIGDHGFVMTLSRRVPGLIAAHLRPWLTTWLQQHDLTLQEVGSWAIHPGGPKILDSVADALCLPADALLASRAILAEFGNMSSPTVLFILERLRQQRAALPCVALGFGPGLTAEAALFR